MQLTHLPIVLLASLAAAAPTATTTTLDTQNWTFKPVTIIRTIAPSSTTTATVKPTTSGPKPPPFKPAVNIQCPSGQHSGTVARYSCGWRVNPYKECMVTVWWTDDQGAGRWACDNWCDPKVTGIQDFIKLPEGAMFLDWRPGCIPN
ncbi:hypothetical protein HK097_008940 [Rhizophlyctis rosea]|uniref:Uncharacterized protein n=1 Tax=Rhizophlyctis rosea TaxID=64517 RepID=A0AAD5SB71_9FUNG|nr:hypothetical protein HK097_008940 [Rhizophlyctis rosea]